MNLNDAIDRIKNLFKKTYFKVLSYSIAFTPFEFLITFIFIFTVIYIKIFSRLLK